MPNAEAARATERPPPVASASRPPIGASTTGSRVGLPRKLCDASISETSRSTRGRKARRSIAWRLRITVVSVAVPPIR